MNEGKKPWEENWTVDPELCEVVRTVDEDLDCRYDGGTVTAATEDRAKLIAEAPAMWRLLSRLCDGGAACCMASADDEGHERVCEFMRIARAIGARK